ncbi:MAG: V-type ATPase subunit [Candidatus Freyarchaeota archaeon]
MDVLRSRDYAQVNAKVRALKSYLLSVGDYEKLVQATNIDDVIRILGATRYAEQITQMELRPPYDLLQIDRVLSEGFLKVFDLVMRSSSGKTKEFLKLYKEKFYYDNLKVIIGAVINKTPKQTAMQYIVSVSPKEVDEYNVLLDSQNINQLIGQVRNRKAREALRAALPQYESLKTPLILESALDNEIHRQLWENINKLPRGDKKYAKLIIGTKIDLINILTILRSKALKLRPEITEQLILPVFYKSERTIKECIAAPNMENVLNILSVSEFRHIAHRAKEVYEETQSLFLVEHALNEYYTQIVYSQLIGFPFHIGVPIAFLELKGQEIRNIKIIIVGKVEAVEPSKIRDLLTIF